LTDLSFDEVYAHRSGLYFAGEGYSVEGGWTEPALRSALDCVIRILGKEESAVFTDSDFSFSEYPSWRKLHNAI